MPEIWYKIKCAEAEGVEPSSPVWGFRIISPLGLPMPDASVCVTYKSHYHANAISGNFS